MKAIDEFLNELGENSEEVIALFREMTELIAFYKRLLSHYELDALTGLPASNKFHEHTDKIGENAENVGVIFFDVNDLKKYNDTMGHKAGDMLLQKASESILHITKIPVHCKRYVFRVGGDEFAAIITDCDQDIIDELLEKWQEKMDELNAVDDGIHCSVAVGSAIGTRGQRIGEVLHLADERMYANKVKMKAEKA